MLGLIVAAHRGAAHLQLPAFGHVAVAAHRHTAIRHACIFFGMIVSCMVKYRENVMLIMVFISIPLLFMTGVSLPQSNIPSYWQGVSWLFPSTFGVRAFMRLNSMGASPGDVLTEYRILWVQAGAYLLLACLVYRFQYFLARRANKKEVANANKD